ncbi:zinc finger BED domain-containing protein RICESLEEPER 2-like protein, partial [Tanacetum coccineum]
SPSVSQGTTFKAVVQPDSTTCLKDHGKRRVFLIDETAGKTAQKLLCMQKDRRVGEPPELHSCPQVARARMSSVEPNPSAYVKWCPKFAKHHLQNHIFPTKDIYTGEEIDQKNKDLNELLKKIHTEYATLLRPRPGNSTSVSSSCGQSQRGKNEQAGPGKGFSYYYSRLKEADVFYLERSDLEVYLKEGIYLCKDNSAISFDILEWWKSHETKFSILSKMTAHILAIPVTTVASEATFSAGGCVIDTYRASLKPETVQALI